MSTELKSITANLLEKGMILKSAYNFVEVTKVLVRAKTTQVFYKSVYDGYESEKPWQFKNEELVRVSIENG